MYISIFLHMLTYKDMEKCASLHPRVLAYLAAASWGSLAWVRRATHPQRGAPIVDRHDRVFFEERCCVALVGDLVDFHASGEGPRGQEILHHAAVPELVLDRVGVARASLLKELLEVIYGWSCMMLATACGVRRAYHAGATRLLVVVTVIVDRGCGLLTALLVPLLAALPSILDDGIGRCFPTATWG
jgi:hypothetical protein